MPITVNAEALLALVAQDAEVETLAEGFAMTEGPHWHQGERFLWFSDMPDDAIYRWDDGSGVQLWRRASRGANGLTCDREGRLIACERRPPGVTRTEHDGTITVVASHHDGSELNGPNDAVVSFDGTIYFTDPSAGRAMDGAPPRQLDFEGVMRVVPGHPVEVVADDFEMPNGLCFSPDERLLYVNDTFRRHIRAFEVVDDGVPRDAGVFFAGIGEGRMVPGDASSQAGGFPDGMKVDRQGNVFVTGPYGIWVISPTGEHLGTIGTVPYPRNLAFGGPDDDQLFICAGPHGKTGLYRIQTKTRGVRPGVASAGPAR